MAMLLLFNHFLWNLVALVLRIYVTQLAACLDQWHLGAVVSAMVRIRTLMCARFLLRV